MSAADVCVGDDEEGTLLQVPLVFNEDRVQPGKLGGKRCARHTRR